LDEVREVSEGGVVVLEATVVLRVGDVDEIEL